MRSDEGGVVCVGDLISARLCTHFEMFTLVIIKRSTIMPLYDFDHSAHECSPVMSVTNEALSSQRPTNHVETRDVALYRSMKS